jgi:RNA polymerase sigma factor (sigma-70 family)
MARLEADLILGHLHKLLDCRSGDKLRDDELLDRFADRHDEEAFAALVERHGPMVLSVCRRVLHESHDVEDAFQATFLVLARKGAAIRKRKAIGCWLHGVAYRVAARLRGARTREHHLVVTEECRTPADPAAEATWREVCAILHEELAQMAETYRAPLLLCGLEEKTRDEAAQQLGWSLGTFKRRLERGRSLLRARLARRGLTLSAIMLGSLLSQKATAVPACLLTATLEVARNSARGSAGVPTRITKLADWVLRSALSTRCKMAAAFVLLLSLVTAGTGMLIHGTVVPRGGEDSPRAAQTPPAPENEAPRALDRYGDALPRNALLRLGTTRYRLGSPFYSCAFSPDGKLLAASSVDPVIRLFEAATGRELRQFRGHENEVPHENAVPTVSFSPDGQTLASGCMDGNMCWWEVNTGKQLRKQLVHPGGVFSVAFSTDGKYLVSGGADKVAILSDAATGKALRRLVGHQAEVRSVAFAPDGRTIASGSMDCTIRLWETATGKPLRELKGHRGPVRAVAFSPDGRLLATGGEDWTVALWEVSTGKDIRWLPRRVQHPSEFQTGESGYIWSLAFSPDGKTLAAGDAFCVLRMWDVASGKKLRQLGEDRPSTWGGWHQDGVGCIAFSRDGKRLAWGEESRLRLWDATSWKELQQFEGHCNTIYGLSFAANGKSLITSSSDHLQKRLEWDLQTGQVVQRHLGPIGPITRTHDGTLSPDWKLLAAQLPSDWKPLPSREVHHWLGLWDAASGRELWRIPLPLGDIVNATLQQIAFSYDGKLLAGGEMADRSIRVWETAGGKELVKLEGHRMQTYCLAFSHDGKRLASGGDDQIVRLYDLGTGKTLRQLKTSVRFLGPLLFSADDKILAVASQEGVIRLWDAATGKLLRQFSAQQAFASQSLAFSPDSRMLAVACADGLVRVVEIATGQMRTSLQGHRGPVYAVAFARSGKILASGSGDTTALLWQMFAADGSQTPSSRHNTLDLDKLWADLADSDAGKAYAAMCRLLAMPENAIPFVQAHLHPIAAPAADSVAAFLKDLDSPRFVTRQQASNELEKLGDAVEPALRKAQTENASLEVRQRIARLLEKLEASSTGERLRMERAMELLEHWGTPVARKVLASLAQGMPEARTTRAAKETLDRLTKE